MHNSPTPVACSVCARQPSVKSDSLGASLFWWVECLCGRHTEKHLFVSAPVAVSAWNRGLVAAFGVRLPPAIHYYKVPVR